MSVLAWFIQCFKAAGWVGIHPVKKPGSNNYQWMA